MIRYRRGWALAGLSAIALVAAACGGSGDSKPAATTKIAVQLKWVAQAQFAGYYAAKAEGFYEAEGLDVDLKPGGPDITPEQVVASGQAQFGLDWLPALLAARDQGGDLVNIAQVFARSGMTELTWKDSGVTDVAGMKGKKVGVWCCGNENELFAALTKNGLDPKKDVTIVNQPFDMTLFLDKSVDAAAAMTYNELAQVLETKNATSGALNTLDDLNVITMESAGTAMLEDGIFTQGAWIADAANQETAKKFLKATFKGWVFCRDNADKCLKDVLDAGTQLGEGHQKWQLNEINALTWPAASAGIGVMDQAAFQRTADIALQFGVIKKAADAGAYKTDLAQAAVDALKADGSDVNGASWAKAVVAVTEGGK